MMLSDVSIRRPVFAAVISMLLLILGVMSALRLPIRQYPDIDPPVVSIETSYPGASAEVVESKITQVIEDIVAGLEGVDKLTSSSRDEHSDVRVEFTLDRDVDGAANDIRDRISRIADNLPEEAERPQISKVDNQSSPIVWLNLSGDRYTGLELTDYAERYLIDRLSVIPGVARVRFSGERRFAMRIWLDRRALAARQLTVADVEDALRRENVELPAGRLESLEREFSLRTDTGLRSEQEFRELVIARGAEGYLVRLGEVAEVRIGPENDRNIARANGQPAISLGIEQISKANTVEVAKGVRAELEGIRAGLPDGMNLEINYDRSVFIAESMKEVVKAMSIAIVLVLIVIYLFLGRVRSTLIPAVTVPISLIATFMVMDFLDFSINRLTLLGLVLAVGLVVDDAIVVLENIHRRIEKGEPPLLAAVNGAREIGFAVIATTLVLIAVFIPISMMEGNIGRLFNEFGIAIAAAVAFSSLVALTLTPMMCSKMLVADTAQNTVASTVERLFRALSVRYEALLARLVRRPMFAVAATLLMLAGSWGLFTVLPREYAPVEDIGVFTVSLKAPEGASLEYTDRHARRMEGIIMEEIPSGDVIRTLLRLPASFGSTGDVNTARAIVLLEDWDKRGRGVREIAASVGSKLRQIPGVTANVILPQGLGVRGDNRPVQLVLGGNSYEELQQWRDELLRRGAENAQLLDLDSNYEERKPQLRVQIDRNRAADLGISLESIGRTLETMLGSRNVTTFIDRGREYDVILQGKDEDRASPRDLTDLYVRAGRGNALVPLSNLVTLRDLAGPQELNRFDRMRAITITAGLAPGYPLGAALDYLESLAAEVLPPYARISYDGESREFKRTGKSLYVTFVLALVVVFLVLAAQFESFRHPLIIMMTVPLGVTGALAGLWLMDSSLNVYSQIGVILLVGLAAKNGVLIVEFANQLRDRGVDFLDAIVRASGIRLRPVLMTSACTTFGAVPLLLATGAGAEARQPIGAVIVCGVIFCTLLTLLIVPAFYSLLARNTRSPEYVARLIRKLQDSVAAQAGRAPAS
jgi:multidrug efflux pump